MVHYFSDFFIIKTFIVKSLSLINLNFKHNFKVLFTQNIIETLEIIINLKDKLDSGNLLQDNTIQNVPKNLIKKGYGIHPFQKMLFAIHGISLASANRIFEKYKSIKELSNAINNELEWEKDLKLNKSVKQKLKDLFC